MITSFFTKNNNNTTEQNNNCTDLKRNSSSSSSSASSASPNRPSKRPRKFNSQLLISAISSPSSTLPNDPITSFNAENVDPDKVLELTSPPPRGRLQVAAAQEMKQQTLTPYMKQIRTTRRSKMSIWSSSYRSYLPTFAHHTMGGFSNRSMDRKSVFIHSLYDAKRKKVRYSVDWSTSRYSGAPVFDVHARVHAYVRSPRDYPSNNMAFTSMAFDNDGVLLVASDPRGGFRLFDFDTYLQASLVYGNQKSRRGRATTVNHSNVPTKTSVKLTPIHCVETEEKCQQVTWHPSNPNYVVAAYRSTNDVHLYDLSQFPQTPKMVFCAKKSKKMRWGTAGKVGSRGVLCFDAAAGRKKGSSGSQIAVAGGESGIVRVWDARVGKLPVYTFGPATNTTSNRNATTSIKKSSVPRHVNALCYSDKQSLLFYGDNTGRIVAHDMRKFDVPAFSLNKVPRLRDTLYLPGLFGEKSSNLYHPLVRKEIRSRPGIVSLISDPSNSGHVTFRTQSGLIGVVDTSRSKYGDTKKRSSNSSSSSSNSSSNSNSSDVTYGGSMGKNGSSSLPSSSLRIIGLSLACLPSSLASTSSSSSTSSTSFSSSSSSTSSLTVASGDRQASVQQYEESTLHTDTSIPPKRPSPSLFPYHALQYMGGDEPLICVGAMSSCTLHLIPVDGNNTRRSYSYRGLRDGSHVPTVKATATHQMEQFMNASKGTNPGDIATAMQGTSEWENNRKLLEIKGNYISKILKGYKVDLENKKIPGSGGGGVTAIACHSKTGSVVVALDNGTCVVASHE